MRKKQIGNIVWSAVLIILVSGLLAGIILKSKNEVSVEQVQQIENVKENEEVKDVQQKNIENKIVEKVAVSATTSINNLDNQITFKIGTEEIKTSIKENSTVLDVMNLLKEENKLSFDGKNYTGLGFFVTEINGLKSSDGKNLMYYINDKEAPLGVSSYVLKEGDVIEWKLK